MSDLDTVLDQEEVVDQEVTSETEEETIDPLRSFVDALQGGNFNDAETMFNDILGDKVQDALDAEKISVADEVFNGAEPLEFEDEEDVWEDEVEYGEEAAEFGSAESEADTDVESELEEEIPEVE